MIAEDPLEILATNACSYHIEFHFQDSSLIKIHQLGIWYTRSGICTFIVVSDPLMTIYSHWSICQCWDYEHGCQ